MLWLASYTTIVLAPLVFIAFAPRTPTRSPWLDFGVGVGFVAIMLFGLQAVLPARARPFTVPFGIDVLLQFHRAIGLGSIVVLLAHVVIVIIAEPGRLQLLNPVTAPWRARAGMAAVVAVLAITTTSLWRKKFRLSYERWRAIHIGLAIVVVVSSVAHMIGVNYYLRFASIWTISVLALAAVGVSIIHLRVGRPSTNRRISYTITDVKSERGGCATLQLQAEGHDGVRFVPGQFAWMKLADSLWSLQEHPFSFSSSASRPTSPSFTIKSLGDFTSGVPNLKAGTTVVLDGPHGSFAPLYPSGPILLIAGGIGITPVMSILRTLADEGDKRAASLLYGSRTWDEITFREEFDELERTLDLVVHHVLMAPHADWDGESGMISPDLIRRELERLGSGCNVFVCGPPPMVAAISKHLDALPIDPSAVHVEAFASV